MRCVLLHAHPDMGGSQRNPIMGALAAALPGEVVRPAFASSDLAVATGQVRDALADGPAWLVGYSFGGGVASLVDDPRVLGWCLVAPALAMVEPVIGADPRPKHVVALEHDTFFPPASLVAAITGWTAAGYEVVPGADHFLAGHETDVARRCASWLLDM